MFAFAEACIGIGLLVSGVFLLFLATLVYSNDIASIEIIAMLAFGGALLGDQAGFYAGRWLGPGFHHSQFASKYQVSIGKAERMIRKYGGLAVLIGRFIPAIRSLIPVMLGLSEFSRSRYLVLDMLACLLWSAALALLVMGIDFGF